MVRKAEPKRRKAAAERKAANVHVRLTEKQKDAIETVAARHGLGVSSWLLMIALRELEKVEREGRD